MAIVLTQCTPIPDIVSPSYVKLSTVPIIGNPWTADWDENSRENHLMAKFTLETKESKGTYMFTESCGGI